MLSVGDSAPPFRLPGMRGGVPRIYRFDETVPSGSSLLVFAPESTDIADVDGSHHLSDLAWFQFTPGLDVYVIATGDRLPSEGTPLTRTSDLPLLSDASGEVASAYGITEASTEEEVPPWIVYLIGDSGSVRARWSFPPERVDPKTIRQYVGAPRVPRGVRT